MDKNLKQSPLSSNNNSTKEKKPIIDKSVNQTSDDTNEWLNQLRDNMLNEEYIRLNYNSIIDSILNQINSIEEKLNEQLLSDLLEVLLKALNYNRSHPSPQRSFNFDQNIEKLVNKLSINSESLTNSELNNQNLLVKLIKYSIKDSSCDNNNNELVINVTEKLLSYLKSLKLSPKSSLSPTEMICLNSLILNTIRCIYLLINNFKYNIVTRDLNQFCGELLGVLKLYSFYGIPGYDISKIRFTSIYPSPISQYMPIDSKAEDLSQRKASANRKTRHKKNKSNSQLIKNQDLEDDNDNYFLNSNLAKTSDSEFSSSDYESNCLVPTSNDLRVQRSISNKIRLISYESLSSAVNLFDKRIIFGFWSSFIPDSSGSLTAQFSTLSSILRDPSARVRSSALSFLYRLLLTGDQYVMTLADDTSNKSSKHLSFTPLSLSLAEMVTEIHNGFCLILFGETNTSVIIQAFRCLSLLITISPYNKLKNGLLTNLFYKSLFMLGHKDIQIQNSCLALSVKIFELEPIPEELKQWISSSDGIQATNKLFNLSFDYILNPQSIILCGESLKLLTTVLRQKLIIDLLLKTEAINISMDLLMNIALNCVSNEISIKNQVIQSLVCKYLFAVGSALKNQTITTEEEILKLKNWWLSVLKSNLICLGLNSDNSTIPQSIQCLIIDFLSTISPEVFDLLENQQKFHLISLLLSIARNEETISEDINCKSAAIRCLGVYQSFKSMTDDLNYLYDVSLIAMEVIENFLAKFMNKKSSHLLLYQSSWTLANFSDILKKFYCDNRHEVTVNFLFRILDSVTIGFDINVTGIQGENIKTNFVRCFGSSLYLVLVREEKESTLQLLDKDLNNRYFEKVYILIKKLIDCLTNSKSFKLHWNVCNVFSYLLSNQLFLDLCKSGSGLGLAKNEPKTNYLLIDYIFDTLITVIKTSRNHKVQSYAVHAICSPIDPYFSGQPLKDLWVLITVFMIDNYYSVPINIRQNWFDKFCLAINKLTVNCFDDQFRNDVKARETVDQLIEFLNSEEFVASCDQQNCDSVKSLIENLKI